MKDFIHGLKEEGIPFLGIKADKYYARNEKELEAKINLKDSLDNLIAKLGSEFEQIVIVIDQIDALSQTNSANGEFVATYKYLVNKVSDFKNIRIVISIREYDLNYDPDFRVFKDYNVFKVGLLTVEEVNKVTNSLRPNRKVYRLI